MSILNVVLLIINLNLTMRNYKRKTNRGSWRECDMQQAMEAVNSRKMSYRQADKQYAVPKTTLCRKVKKSLLNLVTNNTKKNRAPVSSIMGISDSGWITSELFMDFMKHFAVHARCSPDNKTLLIFYGHNTHTKCLAVIDFAISKSIYLLSLPPHVTNKLQPLDRSFFKPQKAYFNNACQRWMRNHPGRCIKTEHLGELLKEAYLKAATQENAGSGFKNSGIVPFNPHVIPEHQLLDDPKNQLKFYLKMSLQ